MARRRKADFELPSAEGEPGYPSDMQPTSPSTHQDSPKVPGRYKIWRGPTGNTVEPLGATPELERGDDPIEVIPISALLFDEVVEAGARSQHEADHEEGFDDLPWHQLPGDRRLAAVAHFRRHLQAAIEQVGGGQGEGR